MSDYDGDILLRKYLGMTSDDINDLDPYRRKSYIDAIKNNINKIRRSARIRMIKRIYQI